MTWTEYLRGGHEIIPEWLIEKRFRITYYNIFYSLMKDKTLILGTWDDNDYGVNDGDRHNPIRHE